MEFYWDREFIIELISNKFHLILGYLVIVIVYNIAEAKVAPSTMKEFNKVCPAPKLCDEANGLLRECRRLKDESCSKFLAKFRELLPDYDCQRPFDKTETKSYIVPALWLCDSRELFISALSEMPSDEAKMLFSSKEFRGALDGAGHLAEEYLPKSIEVERALKKNIKEIKK